jgi:putative membrane protein insertion efficiency factor
MLTKILIALIRVYQQTLSRLLLAAFGPVCRFEPSCSRYAVGCLEGHGALRGTLLSVKRLCKCHPFHPGGFDPPPPPRYGRAASNTMGPAGPAQGSTQSETRATFEIPSEIASEVKGAAVEPSPP